MLGFSYRNRKEKNMKKILWGGATSSSQYEGGYDLGHKGLDTQACRFSSFHFIHDFGTSYSIESFPLSLQSSLSFVNS